MHKKSQFFLLVLSLLTFFIRIYILALPAVMVTTFLKTSVLANEYLLPDTGQSICYDQSGEIPCPAPGEAFYGQDAQYQGYQPYYCDNGDGTVTDLNTGLLWQQNDDGVMRTWFEAQNYCERLEIAGHDDWRLPFSRELFSIVDFGQIKPAINTQYFPGCKSYYYWSNSTHIEATGAAWSVIFGGGELLWAGKSEHVYVRCVRGAPLPLGNYVDNQDGTVTDTVTGLVWQHSDDGVQRTWQQALAYCEELKLAGFDNWRLPNVRELESIVDNTRVDPSIDPVFDCQYGPYWSSTTLHENGYCAWWAFFYSGNVVYWPFCDKRFDYLVRCVRGGLGQPLPDIKANGSDDPITVSPTDSVSITVSLDPGDKAGQNADWWVAATTPFAPPGDWYSYVYPTGWFPGINLCIQTPLFTLSSFEVLNMVLPSGEYTFYFAVDPPDGSPAGPWYGMDSVEVQVQ